jgi:hypothetical protein
MGIEHETVESVSHWYTCSRYTTYSIMPLTVEALCKNNMIVGCAFVLHRGTLMM